MENHPGQSPRGRNLSRNFMTIPTTPSSAHARERTPERLSPCVPSMYNRGERSSSSSSSTGYPVAQLHVDKLQENIADRSDRLSDRSSDRSFDRITERTGEKGHLKAHSGHESDSDAISLHSTMSVPASPLSWVHTTVGDLVTPEKLISCDHNVSVETAFELLAKYNLTCLPLSREGQVFDYFDFADLTGYLLLVLGQITVKGEHNPEFSKLVKEARRGIPAPVGFAAQFGGGRDPFVRMSAHSTLVQAFEKFASGVHRIAVTSSATGEVIGILSQRRLVRYIWSDLRKFPCLESALETSLEDQKIGTYGDVVTVSGDAPVSEALDIMHEKAVSSVAVVDANKNLLGNISVVDVSLLTRAWQAGLLRESCKHFLTVVLDHRGIADGGNESVPVFYVYKTTRLVKVIATLVATRAHRLWICEQSLDPALSGKLVGVVSLTDVLNFVARQSGGQTLDPETARRHRRSSSSSVRSDGRPRHGILHGAPFERPRLSFDRARS